MPDTPTIEQACVANYDLSPWFGMFLPANTPANVVKKIHSVLADSLASTESKGRLFELGAEPAGLGGDVFSAYLTAESTRWGRIIRDRNIKAD